MYYFLCFKWADQEYQTKTVAMTHFQDIRKDLRKTQPYEILVAYEKLWIKAKFLPKTLNIKPEPNFKDNAS